VSRAPLAKLQAYRHRMGWTFPWASSAPGDFNADFNVWFTEQQQRTGIDYNYRREPAFVPRSGEAVGHAAMCGTDRATYLRERPGMSAFVREDGVIYHTYSTYARGLDGIWPTTRGSTGPRRVATKPPVYGGNAMMSMTRAEDTR